MDQPTVLYILYSSVSVQQTNLLPENASQNDAIFARSIYRRYGTTSQCLSSYGYAITVLYVIYCHKLLFVVHAGYTYIALSISHKFQFLLGPVYKQQAITCSNGWSHVLYMYTIGTYVSLQYCNLEIDGRVRAMCNHDYKLRSNCPCTYTHAPHNHHITVTQAHT